MEHRTTRPHATLAACRIRRYVVPFAVLAWLAARPVLAQTGPAQVERVIDGDTITVRLDGVRDTVRLTGVDTPETRHPTQGVEPYGRILRYVMLASGENFNATLIRDGYARATGTFPYSRQRDCLPLDAQARQARRGRWSR